MRLASPGEDVFTSSVPIESAKPPARAGASEPPAELALEGRVLDGRFEVEAPLGEGGLGVVYRGHDRHTDQAVAIKVLRELYGAQRTFRRRFEREARALAALKHPNVVGIVASGSTADVPYLVMPLLSGTTLADVLAAEDALAWPRARELFKQLLDGLAYVHAQGLLHRDLKPGNVFLEEGPEGECVKLLDFGLAKFVGAPRDGGGRDATLTQAGHMFGTPGYMPPEQILGQPTDERADVYSATLLLFEMLAGKRPFTGDLADMMRQQLEGGVPSVPQVRPSVRTEPELQALFEQGLQADPARRFSSVDALRAAFEALPEPAVVAFGRPLRGDFATDDTMLQAVTLARAKDEDSESPAGRAGSEAPSPASAVDAVGWAPASASGSRAHSLLRWLLIAALVGLFVGGLAWRRLHGWWATEPAPVAAERGADPVSTAPGAQTAAPAAAPSEPEAPARWDARARDPLRGALPTHLRTLSKRIAGGDPGNDAMVAALRRHNRDYPNDPRGHLLLARLYLNRGWQRDAVKQYEFAVLRQPGARGDARMLDDLLAMHEGGVWDEAAALIAETYGPEARGPVARLLRSELPPASRRRLEALAARLPEE